MGPLPIPTLPGSPVPPVIVQAPNGRTGRNLSLASNLNLSIRSLMSFRDVFVDRKRIQFNAKLMEGK